MSWFHRLVPLITGAAGVLAGAALVDVAGAAPPAPADYGFGRAETCVLDAESGCTVRHGLGIKPNAIVVTHAGYNGVASVDPVTITDTSYRYVVYRNDGARFAAGIRARWNAHYDLPAPVPPTTAPPTTPPPPPTTPAPTPTPTPIPTPTPTPTPTPEPTTPPPPPVP